MGQQWGNFAVMLDHSARCAHRSAGTARCRTVAAPVPPALPRTVSKSPPGVADATATPGQRSIIQIILIIFLDITIAYRHIIVLPANKNCRVRNICSWPQIKSGGQEPSTRDGPGRTAGNGHQVEQPPTAVENAPIGVKPDTRSLRRQGNGGRARPTRSKGTVTWRTL